MKTFPYPVLAPDFLTCYLDPWASCKYVGEGLHPACDLLVSPDGSTHAVPAVP